MYEPVVYKMIDGNLVEVYMGRVSGKWAPGAVPNLITLQQLESRALDAGDDAVKFLKDEHARLTAENTKKAEEKAAADKLAIDKDRQAEKDIADMPEATGVVLESPDGSAGVTAEEQGYSIPDSEDTQGSPIQPTAPDTPPAEE